MSEGFRRHAAPEAIKAEIERTRKAKQALERTLMELEGFYVIRVAEKASGQWPALLNSACANGNHDRCPGEAYIGHGGMPDAPTPDYALCECECHGA